MSIKACKNISALVGLMGSIFFPLLYADTIRIHNKTDKNVWAGIYVRKSGVLVRAIDPFWIKKQSKVTTRRPSIRISPERYIVTSFAKSRLTTIIPAEDIHKYQMIKADAVDGHNFYIALQDMSLNLFTRAAWKAQRKKSKQENPLYRKPRYGLKQKPVEAIAYNPHSNEVATVRTGNDLNLQERQYLAKRKLIVQKALEKLLGRQLHGYIPNIAIVMNGSGYDAMISQIGQISGLEKIGLLDATTYIVAASSATWFLATWVSLGLPIHKYISYMIPIFTKDLFSISSKDAELMAESLMVKALLQQPITSVDVFNSFLINKFFGSLGNQRQRIYLSGQVANIKSGLFPFPIYTAINAAHTRLLQWYEFTPYEIGASWLGMYIPSWSFGRKFEDNASVDFSPEQPLPLGLWGASLYEPECRYYEKLYRNIESPDKAENFLQSVIDKKSTLFTVNNFTTSKPKSSLKDLKYIRLTDPLTISEKSMPYFAVSPDRPERAADVILFLMQSSNENAIESMREVYAYAQMQGHHLPPVRFDQLKGRTMGVFKDSSDTNVPVIIFVTVDLQEYSDMPMIKNDNCSLANRKYKASQVKRLLTHAEQQIIQHKQTFLDTIAWVVATRSKKSV